MSLIAKSSSGGGFKVCPEGTHLATCFAVVGIGLQDSPWGTKEKCFIGFELPGERVGCEKDGELLNVPSAIWTGYTVSLAGNSNLRKDLESWRGKRFTPEELDGFDLASLIGKACLLSVVHNTVNETTYANVQSVAKVLKGTETPPPELPTIMYSCAAPAPDQWERVPEWLKTKVMNQAEPVEVQKEIPFIDDKPDF